MVERGEEAGLALEAGEALRLGGEGRGEELDSDVAAELRVGGAVHLAHPAGAQGRHDEVGSEPGLGGKGQARGFYLTASTAKAVWSWRGLRGPPTVARFSSPCRRGDPGSGRSLR